MCSVATGPVMAKASEVSSMPVSSPHHLLVLVHGILGSRNDWNYVEGQLKKELEGKFLLHASVVNTYLHTFSGIDVAGRRLAEEVEQVVKENPSLKRISFMAHSLGGLFSRYAIAVSFSSQDESQQGRTIAGLEPISFITLATPHLGVRGRNQLPFLLGIPFLERFAPAVAHYIVGRTGWQLFLRDEEADNPPLLRRMASDYYELKFISALESFRSRVCYANVGYDHMVGWRTSSIRRETELPKISEKSLDGYNHVVNVMYCPPVHLEMPSETMNDMSTTKTVPDTRRKATHYEKMEEEMIQELQQVGWCKVDVSFHSAVWPFFAHNHIHDCSSGACERNWSSYSLIHTKIRNRLKTTQLEKLVYCRANLRLLRKLKTLAGPMQVKQEWLHSAGAGVVAHVGDSLKQQESQIFISSNL